MTGADRIIGVCAILASTSAEALGQLAFKRAASKGEGSSFVSAIGKAMRNFRWVAAGWLAFAVEAVLWSLALYHLDISVAHPIGSLVFVAVAVASRWILGERISPLRWAGISLILAGSALVAMN